MIGALPVLAVAVVARLPSELSRHRAPLVAVGLGWQERHEVGLDLFGAAWTGDDREYYALVDNL